MLQKYRNSRPEVFCKKVVLRSLAKFTGKTPVPKRQACNFIKKEALALMAPSENKVYSIAKQDECEALRDSLQLSIIREIQ